MCETIVVIAQGFNLAYLTLLAYNLNRSQLDDMITYARLYLMTSIAFLYAGFLCEIYFFMLLQHQVHSQAHQESPEQNQKGLRQKKECLSIYIVFIAVAFVVLILGSLHRHRIRLEDSDWTELDEIETELTISFSSGVCIAMLLCALLAQVIVLVQKTLTQLKVSYKNRYKQFRRPILKSATWLCIGISLLMVHLALQAFLHKIYLNEKLVENLFR